MSQVASVRGHAAYAASKARALAAVRGRVLEIGAGDGKNFDLLPSGVEWLGLEPLRGRRRVLERKAAEHGHRAPVLDGVAESIPLPDTSVDAVVATAVLCSVRDQDRALAEVSRVLRPGGLMVLAEHVAAPDLTWRRRLQGAVAPFSRVLDHGCDPTRDTEDAVRRSPLRIDAVEHFDLPVLGRLTQPFVVIHATSPPPRPCAPRSSHHPPKKEMPCRSTS